MRTIFLTLFAGCALVAAPQEAAKDTSKDTPKQTAAAVNPNQALVNKYCVTCHNQRLKTAKLALDQLDLVHPEKDALTWERAIRKLRGGMMPPPGAPRPLVDA